MATSIPGAWKDKVRNATVAAVFLGTPLHCDAPKKFKAALRACATVELSSASKSPKPSNNEIRAYADMILELQVSHIRTMSAYETLPCQYKGHSTTLLRRRSKIVS